MKKSSLKSMMILALSAILVACGSGNGSTFVIPKDVPYLLGGRTAKKTYRALLATSVGNLNYLETQEAVDAQHFANFIDGLLLHNEFGVLEKNLATKVEANANYTQFTFTVKEGVPWVRYDGTQYKAIIGGVETPQYVEPEDFLTTALEINKYNNQSGLQYLIGMFVAGAEEYYHYTYIQMKAADGERKYVNMLNNPADCAKEINNRIKENSAAVYNQVYKDNPLTAEDIPNIANGNRFGVKVDAEKRTVTYDLIMSASYFPTLFTYSCYLPTNKYFLKETKFSNFGVDNKSILYNGPYLLSSYDEKQATYTKNPTYWNKDIYVLDKIEYRVAPDDIGYAYTREEFENDRIDGFSVNSQDSIGWTKYITGPELEDGTFAGDITNPVNPNVNARLLDTIGNMYGSNIVMGRDVSTFGTYTTGSTAATVANTARAFSLNPVRKAVLAALDYPTFFERYGAVELEQKQQLVHTYVPKGFVINDDGDDYVEGNYLPYYAQQKGIPEGSFDNPQPGTAAWDLAPGQYDSRIVSQEEMNVLVADAKKAIELYNADQSHTPITYPIRIEYFSLWFDSTTQTEDKKVLPLMNQRLNGGEVKDETSQYQWFQVLPTDLVTSANYEAASRSANWDYAAVQWGWGADYGDPLTFMNTYRKGGDWADVFPFIAHDYVANFNFNENGTALVESDLLGEYTEIVAEGSDETEDINRRYDLFAEAEYLLINELNFYRPMVNNGQGWAVSVSLAAGYLNPTSSFGLSNDRLTGMYVLTREDMFDREDREAARAQHAAAKEAYLAKLKAEGKSSINIYD